MASDLGLSNSCRKGSVDENFRNWLTRKDLKNFRALPFLVLWGDLACPELSFVFLKTNKSLRSRYRHRLFLPFFPTSPSTVLTSQGLFVNFLLTNLFNGVLFYGVCQCLGRVCAPGFVLYLSELHYFIAKANLGSGTNNVGELRYSRIQRWPSTR